MIRSHLFSPFARTSRTIRRFARQFNSIRQLRLFTSRQQDSIGVRSPSAQTPLVERCARKSLSRPVVEFCKFTGVFLVLIALTSRGAAQEFSRDVKPFLKTYCLDCHGASEPEAKLDLSPFDSPEAVGKAHQTWEIILHRLEAGEMPPKDSDQPTKGQRYAVVNWIKSFRRSEAERNAGDPGPVLVRRLNNAEYNYTIRDITGVDIRPTETFPVDPANEAGFDNSGESLTMSPALLNKYLAAARQVAEHLVLTPGGIAFAPHPVVTDTDRDKYCVNRIVQFYQRQPTNLADYFYAARQHRLTPASTVDDLAKEFSISTKYLSTIVELLDEKNAVGPVERLQQQFSALCENLGEHDQVRRNCEDMQQYVTTLRRKLIPIFESEPKVEGIHKGAQPFVLWRNRYRRDHRLQLNNDALVVAPDTDSGEEEKFDPELVIPGNETQRMKHIAAFEKFCSVFPDAFYISERGRDYVKESSKQQGEKGRLLSAGFHSMMGYFRDDRPLYELILDREGQQELDRLWQELNYIASAPMRQYVGFLWFERTDSPYMRDPQFDFARPENKASLSQPMIERLANVYLEKAVDSGAGTLEEEAIQKYFDEINDQIRWVESHRKMTEGKHLAAITEFAARAFRRPLTLAERSESASFYTSLRSDGLSHEEAIQDTLVSILMSPRFTYRLDLLGAEAGVQPLNNHDIASRLSFFLWASVPDEKLKAAADRGELTKPDQLIAQARRMMQDDRARGLATEFGGNWLDFRRFKEHNSVDRDRFPQFTNELRSAMFEEPIRFFVDLVQRDGSVTEFIDAKHTFVNKSLAQHYGIPFDATIEAASQTGPANAQKRSFPGSEELTQSENAGPNKTSDPTTWQRVPNAADFQRGGLLPMSVFLTKNAPGLRTSPVKRGYWVVRRLLGERIPPPPPNVPELPADESKLGELTLREALAKHRDHKACAGCHNRFDAIGVAFEGFGPVGERREKDLGGRPVVTSATLPGAGESTGLAGLREYLQQHRQEEFVDNLCRKLLSYALGRSLILSDDLLIEEMKKQLSTGDNRFSTLVETIICSPQFLNKRG